ncbi:Transcription factor [Vigna unguiculata]|uniref:Transcription factor n=1 Tax=Vigna unguiculata TaxID=3917 RepID=A0A4D6KKE7_VIGUN|nr:Transcription factor [Vigna unguiculata]
MSRRKVQLTFIANNSDRKASYIKRKKSLLKKTEEISTLCGVEACTIVYGPYAPVPDVWTSKSGVQNVMMPPPAVLPVAAPENIIVPPNHGDGTYLNSDDPLQSQWFMELLNDNGDEETMKSSFGDPNLPPL